MNLHQIGKVMHVDHTGLHAGCCEPVHAMVDQGLTVDLDQRFRRRCRQRAHALAEACGQDHGFGRAKTRRVQCR